MQLELQLLSNNIKHRKTISVMTLATRVIDHPELLSQVLDPWKQIQTLRRQATSAIKAALAAA